MDVIAIDIGEIAELATEAGITGAIRTASAFGGDMFEYIVGIAALIYELYPNG